MEIITSALSNPKVQATVGVALATLLLSKLIFKKKKVQRVYKEGVVYIYDFPPSAMPKVKHASPFVLKVVLFCKVNEIPYEIIPTTNTGPRSKLPFVKVNGETVCDSHFIIKHLSSVFKTQNNLYVPDSEVDRANEVVLRRFVEDAVYWYLVYYRWVDPVGSGICVPLMLAGVPGLIRPLISKLAKGGVSKVCHGGGISRYTEQEREALIKDDIDALATLLGSKKFFFGDQMSYVDICIYSLLCQFYFSPVPEQPHVQKVKSKQNLSSYIERIHSQYFNDSK